MPVAVNDPVDPLAQIILLLIIGRRGKEKGDPAEHRLFLSGSVSLIHNVTFKEERETGPACSSLVPVWLQVRVRTRAYCHTGSDGQYKHLLIKVGCLLSAARKREVAARLGLAVTTDPTVTFPPNAAVTLACAEMYEGSL